MNKKRSTPPNLNDHASQARPHPHTHRTTQQHSQITTITPVDQQATAESSTSTVVTTVCTMMGGVAVGALLVLAFTFGGDAVRSEMINDATAALAGSSNSTKSEDSNVPSTQKSTPPPFNGRRQSTMRGRVDREVTETTDIVGGVAQKIARQTIECTMRYAGDTFWNSMKN